MGPGLLQTREYAQALLDAHFPPLDEETVKQRVETRLARRELLAGRKPLLVLVFVIEEAVLHRRVGGPAVLKGQLRRLLECVELRNVETQVMPTARGAHSGLNGAMVLLETLGGRRLVYIESQRVSVVVSDQEQASEFGMRYGMLRSQALGSGESARLIERMAGEL